MIRTVDCPRCNGGKLILDVAKGYVIITSGKVGKLPLKTVCKNCNREIKYMVVREEDYDKTIEWLQQK